MKIAVVSARLYVGDIKKFTALPGSSGKNYAVRLTSVIREEQEDG